MELDHSAESALSFYLAGSRRKIENSTSLRSVISFQLFEKEFRF